MLIMPLLLAALSNFTEPVEPVLEPVIDATAPEEARRWRPVLDGVMGGLSTGVMARASEGLRFSGEVSLENNGGFSSFRRSTPLPDLSAFDGLRIRVRGDGQVYKLNLRTEARWDGMSWRIAFPTKKGEWTTHDVAFEDFIPTWRGRLVTRATSLDTSSIDQVSLMITDKQEGPFQIDVASIEAWRRTGPPETLGTWPAKRARTADLGARMEARPGGKTLLDSVRMNERLLVVSVPSALEPKLSMQMAKWSGEVDEFAVRDLRIVHLIGSRGGRVAGRPLDGAAVRDLREEWSASGRRFEVLLVGKDGTVKERFEAPVDGQSIYALIDAMPMRKAELRTRS